MDKLTVSEEQKSLQQKRVTLESLVSKDKRKYFHLNTLGNFVYHYKSIANEDDRQWVYNTLYNYFDMAVGLNNEVDIDSSKAMYEEHLAKVAMYYDKYLGFTMYVYLWVITIMYLMVLLVISLVANIFIGLLTLGALFIYHMTYLYKKHKQKKLFGTFY